MTTHDMQPEMVDPAVRADRPAEPAMHGHSTEPPLDTVDATPDFEAPGESHAAPVSDAPVETAHSAPIESGQAPVEAAHAAPLESENAAPLESENAAPLESAHAAPVESAHAAGPAASADTDQMLFADGELTDMRSRWTEVQSAFVDDPRDCVQKADGLVSDVVDRLTTGFAQARSGLEEQWSRGEEVSTEDLRLALKRYREFFERLLAV